MENKKIALDVVNPHAAGIDVGSRSQWLLANEIKTVAMESTGT